MTTPREERPVELGGVPDEEDINAADAADRVDDDPREQPNFTDHHPRGTGIETDEA